MEQDHGLCARLLDLHRERIAVGVANLGRPDLGIQIDDFISSGQHSHARSNQHLDPRPAHRRRECNASLVQPRATIEQKAATFRFVALSDDVFAGHDSSYNLNRIARLRCVLHHDDGVSARRHGRSGHDRECFCRIQCG